MTIMTTVLSERRKGSMAKNRAEWTVSAAKARSSEVVQRALSEGPQTVSRNGRDAVVVSVEEWRRKKARKENHAESFADSPLKGSGIDLERVDDGVREVDLRASQGTCWIPT